MATPASNRQRVQPPTSVEEASELPNIASTPIAVLAGRKTFHIHHDVLARSSEFLKNALKPEWRTDPTKPIDLTDECSATFEGYVQWLYTKKVLAKSTNSETWLHLARLYVLGEKLVDTTFQDSILDAMIGHKKLPKTLYPCSTVIKTIYDGTTQGSPARRLMVDFWAYSARASWHSIDNPLELSDFRGTDFLEEMVPVLITQRNSPEKSVPRPWKQLPHPYRETATNKGERGPNSQVSRDRPSPPASVVEPATGVDIEDVDGDGMDIS